MKALDACSGSHLARGVELLKLRNWGPALEHLTVAKVLAQSNEDRSKALFALGCLYEEQHNFGEAMKHYKLVVTEPFRSFALFRQGVGKMQEGAYMEASLLLEGILGLAEFPSRAALLQCLFACYSRLNLTRRIEEIESLMKHNGLAPVTVNQMLHVERMIKSERWVDARTTLLCMVAAESDVRYWSALGVCHFMLQDFQQAYACFRRCIELDSESVSHRTNIILAAGLIADCDLGQKIASEYEILLPDSSVRKFFMASQRPAAPPVAARVKRRRGLPGTPWFVGKYMAQEEDAVVPEEDLRHHAVTLCNLGCSALEIGVVEHARVLLSTSRRLDPKCFEADFNLGTLELMEGHLDEAVELLESAAKAFPSRPAVLVNYGIALVRLSRYQQALLVLQSALDCFDCDPQLFWLSKLTFGRAKIGLSDFEGAMNVFHECFAATDSTEALCCIADGLLSLGSFKEALLKAIICVEREPENPEYRFLLGRAKWKNDDLVGAIDAFEQCVTLKGCV